MSQNIIHVGIDLGSFKTSIVSSNGRRHVLPTAVGWARDHISRSMLGNDVVFGDDIWKQRMALDIVRPFEKGVLKYTDPSTVGVEDETIAQHKEAARLVVEHAVTATQPPRDMVIRGVVGAPSRASVANKQVLFDACEQVMDAVVIVPEPFAISFGMNRLTNTLVVDIGAGTIDICPVYGTYPADEDQVTLPLGGDVIDQRFCELVNDSHPEIRLTANTARKIKERYRFVHDVNEQAVVELPAGGRPQQVDVTAQLKEACRTIVQPITSGIREVLDRFDPEFQAPLRQNILLGGGGSQLKGLDQLIEQSLAAYGGGTVTRVYDFVFAGAVGALRMAMEMPAEYWDSMRQVGSKTTRRAA